MLVLPSFYWSFQRSRLLLCWFFPPTVFFSFKFYCFPLLFLPYIFLETSLLSSTFLRWGGTMDYSLETVFSCTTVNFFLSTLPASHTSWYITFLFSFSTVYFFSFLKTSSLIHELFTHWCLVTKCLDVFLLSGCYSCLVFFFCG